MARYTDSVCRQCRRENLKLFLKGDRCYSDKCAFDRRGYPPGQHGERRGRKPSDYGIQLREKQKVKRMYGLTEKQFHLFFNRAERQRGITGTNLLVLLERRLDNVATGWDLPIRVPRRGNLFAIDTFWLMVNGSTSRRSWLKSAIL